MHGQDRMPDWKARQRHARNAQAACQQLETFTTALDDLIAQIESEMHHRIIRDTAARIVHNSN
jgi:hypothetical protein